MRRMHDNVGFTLIELLVAIAIIGILSAVGYPMYTDYVKRSKISEAIAELSNMKVKMGNYFLDNRTYAGACDTNVPPKTVAPLPTGQHFKFTCTDTEGGTELNTLKPEDAPVTTYVIKAEGKVAGLDGADGSPPFVYTINEKNIKKTISTSWGKSSDNCWIIKSDGSC